MAIKRTTPDDSDTSLEPDANGRISEPVAARALQAVILSLGVMLLFSVLFGGRSGPAIVGALIFVSAFPPARRHVDRWLVGKAHGDEANQAAVIRMAIGIAIFLIALSGLLPI
jgi:hypothetical protein